MYECTLTLPSLSPVSANWTPPEGIVNLLPPVAEAVRVGGMERHDDAP
jgi:hypothetical protein